MACEAWREKLDAYLDGELQPTQTTALNAHLRECTPCAARAFESGRLKQLVATAGRRYRPTPELRARIALTARPRRHIGWSWQFLALPAALALIAVVAVNLFLEREHAARHRIYSELADLHVAALASATPVDVLSSDRHTVKPWFQGKIPFTFNLPELEGSEFTLLGGRVTYLAQAPGAHLIYRLRKHEISVFIFPESGADMARLPSGAAHALSFNMQTWTQDGLRYFMVGDVSPGDIEALGKLLRGSG